jgi:uncharacterized membrane protein
MTRNRVEAFSDGVIAIIITIMVLELRPPHGAGLAELRPLLPVFLSYVMSFVYLGIYWNNHHHLMHAVQHVDGRTLWANSHLLFWLSLVPFATAWLGETHFAAWPVSLYGAVMLLAGVAYYLLVRALLATHDPQSALAQAIGRDFKGKVSVGIYAIGIALSHWSPALAMALYLVVSCMWLIPDRRIERVLYRRAEPGVRGAH